MKAHKSSHLSGFMVSAVYSPVVLIKQISTLQIEFQIIMAFLLP